MIFAVEGEETRQHFWPGAFQEVGCQLFEQQFVAQVVLCYGIVVPVEATYRDGRLAIFFWLKYLGILLMQVLVDDALLTRQLLRDPERGKFELPLVGPQGIVVG